MSKNFSIRPARTDEADVIANLHYRAYANRFFDTNAKDRNGVLYGAPLANDFPVLARGQNEEYFRQYWDGFMKGVNAPDQKARNYCFVATENDKPIAFIKGSGAPIGGQMRDLFNRAALGNGADCCELGSIYCDPDAKNRGAGRKLVAEYTRAMMGLGYKMMVTEAYAKNDSPAFFEILGARQAGTCSIPNEYLDDAGRLRRVDIPGVWLYWDQKSMNKAAGLLSPQL